MIFDHIRQSRGLKLAALFGFAAASATSTLPRETPEALELRILTAEYTKQGPLMATDRFERFNILYKQARGSGDPALLSALSSGGFCVHSSGSSSGGSSGSGFVSCPSLRRRIAKGDMGHLLAVKHWL